jgi:UPF0755 protein
MSRTRKRSPLPLLIGLLLIVICCSGGLYYYGVVIPHQVEQMFGDPSPDISALQKWQYSYRIFQAEDELLNSASANGDKVLFTIAPAEQVSSVVARLSQAGLIRSSQAFTSYLIYKGYDRSLRSGDFYLQASMTGIEIADKIHTPGGDRTEFGSIAGWRAEEVAGSLASYGFQFSADDFLSAVQHPGQVEGIPAMYQQFPSLEGFLFPGSYPIDRDITAAGLTGEMVNAFDQAVTPKMRKGFQKNGLSFYQAVILASIVEKESVLDEEKPVIASVFYNRLASGMKLETDPTVQYALGYNSDQNTWWTNPLSAADLQVQSPFNTYLSDGLPPAPISNPGIEALRAVAFPEKSSYYYFRAACDGSGKHNFASSLDEHIQNACP